MLRRITKSAARKLFATGTAIVVVCPCKLAPWGSFSPGVRVAGKEYLERAEGYRTHPDLWTGSVERTAWDLMYNNWVYYNTSYEQGYYAHYYVES